MDQVDKILERDWDAANQHGQEALAAGPLAESAYYDQPTGKIVVELNNGVGLHIPPALIQGMENATPAELAEIVIEGHGIGLHFPRLDANLYVPALARGVLGTAAWMRSLGRKGGISKALPRQRPPEETDGLAGVHHQQRRSCRNVSTQSLTGTRRTQQNQSIRAARRSLNLKPPCK